jgi:hypothetical protein
MRNDLPLSRFVALRLSKEGFGSVVEIERTPTDVVMDMLHFMIAQNQYEETREELNK